jgi:hypothetical protein
VIANMAIDLWAQDVLRRELTEVLDAAVSGRPVRLPDPDRRPVDQASADADGDHRALPAFWQHAVETAPSGAVLMTWASALRARRN